jgi:hypothetical protein
MHMRHFHISYKWQDCHKKVIDHNACVDFSVQHFTETFLILSRIDRDMIRYVNWSSCNIPLMLNQIWMKHECFGHILEKCWNITFNANQSRGSRVVPCGQEDGRSNAQTDMKKLIVAFRAFANALKKSIGRSFVHLSRDITLSVMTCVSRADSELAA